MDRRRSKRKSLQHSQRQKNHQNMPQVRMTKTSRRRVVNSNHHRSANPSITSITEDLMRMIQESRRQKFLNPKHVKACSRAYSRRESLENQFDKRKNSQKIKIRKGVLHWHSGEDDLYNDSSYVLRPSSLLKERRLDEVGDEEGTIDGSFSMFSRPKTVIGTRRGEIKAEENEQSGNFN